MSLREVVREHAARIRPNRVVIGLTGPIASGKSTIGEMLVKRGATVIDADRVYRLLMLPGSDLWQQVVARFGPEIVGDGQEIDRGALGRIVFRDPAALTDLETITHPAVVAEIRRQIANATTDVIVVEAIKLVQSGLLVDVDELWFVTADSETRTRRLMLRRGLDQQEARSRIAASPPALPPDVRADVVIENSGELSAARQAVETAWHALETGASGVGRLPASLEINSEEGN